MTSVSRALILVLVVAWLSAFVAQGANPSYTAFRGTGGILVTTNPPTGLIVIDGSAVFTSSGTNATIATSTNGVLVAAASTNINFVTGTNMVIRATNTASSTHISFNSVIPPEAKTVAVAVNGTTITLVATQLNFVQGINTLVTGTNISGGYMHVGINLKPNLTFSSGAGDLVLGTWGNVFGISNVASGDLMFYNPDPGAGNDVVFDGLISAVNANLSLLAGTGDFVSISPGGTLQRTNGATQSQLTTLSNALVILSSNVAPAPPLNSVQFNSNGVQQGSADFLFTNGVATVGQGVEVTTGSFVLNGGTTALVAWNGLGRIRWDADGVMRIDNDAALSFNRINLGGIDAGFPSIGRTNGDVIILGANGAFGAGATNRLHVPGGIVLTNANVSPGRVWTAVGPFGAGTWSNAPAATGITSINEDTTANHTISLVTNLTRPFPGITNPLGLTEINIPWAAAAVSGALHSNDFKRFTTNALIQTNGVNVGSIGTLNWTAGITGSVSGTVVTLGASAAAGGFSVSGNSNQIPYLNQAGNAFLFGAERTAPGFGFSRTANWGNGALMVNEDQTNVTGLLTIGPPNPGSYIVRYTSSLTVSNRYGFDSGINGGNTMTQDMVNVNLVDLTGGSDPESSLQQWKWWPEGASTPTIAARLRKDGVLSLAHGTLYPSNSLSSTMPTATQLGPGGYWVGNSNASLVTVYSLNGSTTAMKILAP